MEGVRGRLLRGLRCTSAWAATHETSSAWVQPLQASRCLHGAGTGTHPEAALGWPSRCGRWQRSRSQLWRNCCTAGELKGAALSPGPAGCPARDVAVLWTRCFVFTEGAVPGLSPLCAPAAEKEQGRGADGVGDRWEKPSPRHRGFRGRVIYTSPHH